jgi:hypothetical protein
MSTDEVGTTVVNALLILRKVIRDFEHPFVQSQQ